MLASRLVAVQICVVEYCLQRNKIFDGTSVRPSVVIGPPTNATDALIRYYNNQIININQVVEGEEIIDKVRTILMFT